VSVAEIAMHDVHRHRIPQAISLFEKALVKLARDRIFSMVPKIHLS
jgi:hypothetical protein